MSLLRALRAYVGLGPDEDYEVGRFAPSNSSRADEGRSLADNDDYWNYGAEPDPHSTRSQRQADRMAPSAHGGTVQGSSPKKRRPAQESASRAIPQEPVIDLRSQDESESDGWTEEPMNESDDAVIRSLDAVRARPKTVSPESFAEARELADEFRVGVPVVLNLQGLERDLARRLIDFASGVCYCLDGTMEKIGSAVFLLTPEGVQVAEEDRMRIQQRGYAR